MYNDITTLLFNKTKLNIKPVVDKGLPDSSRAIESLTRLKSRQTLYNVKQLCDTATFCFLFPTLIQPQRYDKNL